MMSGRPPKKLDSGMLDLSLRVLALVLAVAAMALFWVDLLTLKGAIGLIGAAVIALTLERIKDY